MQEWAVHFSSFEFLVKIREQNCRKRTSEILTWNFFQDSIMDSENEVAAGCVDPVAKGADEVLFLRTLRVFSD